MNEQFPMEITITMPQTTVDLFNRATALSEVVVPKIESADDYSRVAGELKDIKGVYKQIDEGRKSITKPLDDAKSAVMEHVKPYLAKLDNAENIRKKEMIAYDNEQGRLRRIAEAEAAERARKEREKLEAKALKAEEKGNTEKAEAFIDQANSVVADVAVIETAKVSGITRTFVYGAEVTDLMALVKAVAEGKAPLNLLQPDTKVIGAMARSLKDSFDGMYPGIKLTKEASISSRSNAA